MNHATDPDPMTPALPYHRDYTESMQTDTLLRIRNDLSKSAAVHNSWTWESKRYARISQVLRKRGLNLTTKTMTTDPEPKPKPKKDRNVKHIPKSWTEKPAPITRMTSDDLEEARRQAAKYLAKP